MFKRSKVKRIIINQEPTGCFLAEVGCVKIPIKDSDQLIQLLRAYLDNPEKIEQDYQSCREDNMQEPIRTATSEILRQYASGARGLGSV